MQVEQNVQTRYAEGAKEKQEALCCPVDYQSELLAILPQEIIEKDYGCGDPSRYVKEGDVVLDLGSGGGKICYMAAQLVGDAGRVIGVDMTDDMLALARRHQADMAETLGGDRVSFKKGYIQDLALDVQKMEGQIAERPIQNLSDYEALTAWKTQQRADKPLIEDASVTLVVSNCVLNLVNKADRSQMLKEIYRVLKPGGRVAISDIISDDVVPEALQNDPTLWSGCISGAFQEEEFLQAFLDAGFVNVSYDKWDEQPWQVVEGIEFRSATLVAVKPSRESLYDAGQAVIYRGPFAEVHDDLGNIYTRGQRIAVSKRTYDLLMASDLAAQFIGFSPEEAVNRGCFTAPAGTRRPSVDTKGGAAQVSSDTQNTSGCC